MDRGTHSPVLFAVAMTATLFLYFCGRTGPMPPVDNTPPRVSATVPTNGSTNIPVNLHNGIVITFSKRMNPATINTRTITLGEEQGDITGTVSYSDLNGVPTAVFAPSSSLRPATLYRLDVDDAVKDVYGIAMTAPYISSFLTSTAPDGTPPVVASTIPAQGDVSVAPTTVLAVSFTEPVVPETIVFSLRTGSVAVPCRLSSSGETAVCTPLTPLAYDTTYTATVYAGVTDLAGNVMPSDYVWSFMTSMTPDETPPAVASTIPTQGDVSVAPTTALAVSFTEPVMPETTIFSLSTGSVAVPCSLSSSNATAVCTPLTPLAYDTAYTATVYAGVTDLAGNAMPSDYVWSFMTGTAPDGTLPAVASTIPAQGDVSVAPTTVLTVTFTEPVVPETIVFSLSTGGIAIPCSLSSSGATAVCTPLTPLAYDTTYTATVYAGVTDLAGNVMPSDYVWSFVTMIPDTVPPGVSAVFPAAGATNVNDRPKIRITFTEAVDPATINFLLSAGTSTASCPLLYSGVTATCTPSAPLKKNTLYTAQVPGGVQDLAGNVMESDFVWSFKTK